MDRYYEYYNYYHRKITYVLIFNIRSRVTKKMHSSDA